MSPECQLKPRSMGIYIHFPWCIKKCPYCDFLSIARDPATVPHQAYSEAVRRELAVRAAYAPPQEVHSLFFGGGTPSLWQAGCIGEVIGTVRSLFDVAQDAEITVECNPSSFDSDYAEALSAQGVGRVSLGLQSLDDSQLRFLGRWHDAREGLDALGKAVASSVPRVSADLIHSVAGQRPEQAAAEARRVAEMGVGHVSAYGLTVEPGTRFGALDREGKLPLLSESQSAESFEAVAETLTAQGFGHYEISNFARPGQQSRHNLGYWLGRDYLGAGCGAWGTISSEGRSVRYRNLISVDRYMAQEDWTSPLLPVDEAGQAPRGHQSVEALSVETRIEERLMLGLRLARGLELKTLEEEVGATAATPGRLARAQALARRGRLEIQDGVWKIPKSQWLFADGTIAGLL